MTLLTVDSRNLTGKPTPGVLKISTSRKPIFDTQSKVTFSGEAVEPLGADGKASVELPPSNGAHTGAVFLYSFEVQLAGFGTWVVRNAFLPDMGTIDLSELHNSAPAPGEPTRIVRLPADGADGQVLVWDGGGFSWEDSPPGLRGPEGPIGPQGPRGLTGPQGPAIDINTGLPIQIDTTVGTRVLIGGHMVHGDTGWRDVSSLLINGWTGHVEYRRVNDSHRLNVHSLDPTNATNPRFLSDIPNGPGRANWRGATFTTSTVWNRLLTPTQYFTIPPDQQFGEVRWSNTTAWPTALPGLPS